MTVIPGHNLTGCTQDPLPRRIITLLHSKQIRIVFVTKLLLDIVVSFVFTLCVVSAPMAATVSLSAFFLR
jgi:hypothetical protein